MFKKMRARIRLNNLLANNPKRDNVFKKNWDFLFILDGCRFDTFKKINFYSGSLEKIVSLGSCTSEFIINSIKKTERATLNNIIYVSGNPYVSNIYLKNALQIQPFFEIIDVWINGFDMDLNTVHPSEINKAFLLSLNRFKNKGFRYVIHYMQPHHPFIGDNKINIGGWKNNRDQILNNRKSLEYNIKVWDLIKKRKVTVEKAYAAYEANLKLVLDYIKEVLPYLEGKICLTSDHGNLFGEKGFYSHPCELIHPNLLNVPWFLFDRI
jgi:hypothetical protein